MASNLRRSKRTVGKRITDIDKKVERLRKANAPTRVGENVISDTNLSADITANKVTAGTLIGVEIKAGTPYGSPVKYPFSVSSTGVVNSVSGTIGAFTLSTSTLTAESVLAGGSGITTTTELSLGNSGQIYSRWEYVNQAAGVDVYSETYINRRDDFGGITIEGDTDGSVQKTVLKGSVVKSGGSVETGNTDTDSNYTFKSALGDYTHFGTGDNYNYAMKTRNGQDLYENNPGGTEKLLYVRDNNELVVVTSSQRYKQSISSLGPRVDYKKILEIEPVTFLYNVDVEQLGDKARLISGVIAEQVDSIGLLGDLVIYNREGLPESFRYEKLAVYLLEVCRQQEEAIENLRARVAELEV